MSTTNVPTNSAPEHIPLTEQQQTAFTNFKELATNAGLYTPSSHDDTTMLRFLRARRYDPQEALKQFTSAESWRKQHNVDTLFATFDPDEYENAKKFYPRWTGRRDNHGRPVYVYRLASLAPVQKELNSVPSERRYQRIISLYEFMTRLILPLCTHLPHKSQSQPISSVTTIIDLSSVSITSMWSLRSHLQEASKLATANYPETLSTIAVVNSPSFFPTIWGWIKGWFDEGTRNKIYVLGRDPGTTLREIILPQNLPKVYGGELDWTCEDTPNLDDETKQLIGEMPHGPAIFQDGKVIRPQATIAS